MASSPGEFNGSAAEINGQGFAGMRFVAKSVSGDDFNIWIRSVRQGANKLDANGRAKLTEYNKLAAQVKMSGGLLFWRRQKFGIIL